MVRNQYLQLEYAQFWKMDNVETKHTEVCKILTRLTGKEPVKKIERSTYLLWEYHNITIKLYENGRMVMYLSEG